MSLEGKHALITGSSQGHRTRNCAEACREWSQDSYSLLSKRICCKRDAGGVPARGSDGFVVQADVCRPEDITGMFRKVRAEFGRLDVFVSNARPEVSFQSGTALAQVFARPVAQLIGFECRAG